MSSDHAAAPAPAPAPSTQAKKDRHMVSWTQEEDDLLRAQVALHGSDNWTIVAAQFKDKTGRQCRRRWLTYLNTECKKGGWSQEEDMLLCEAQKIFGNRWTEIAKVVTGRTDNAVKNRFSTLRKKRAKHHVTSDENNNSCLHPSNKKIMIEPSANKQQNRYGDSSYVNSHESLTTSTHDITGTQSRPPLAILLLINLLRNASLAIEATANCEVQGNFLRRDDPKLTALLQQAELLSSLAVKACSENRNQSSEDAWKELQSYMICTREGGSLSSFSEMDFLLDNFEGVFEDFQCGDTEIQLSTRVVDLENSQTSSEISTGCTHDDPRNNVDKHQLNHCSVGCNEGESHQHEGISAPVKFVCQGGTMSPSLELTQNRENLLVSSKSEFDSPLKTIPPFHSFTEEIPSPEFSSSERKFLLSVLGASSSKSVSNTNQTPCKRDPRPNSNQSHSCKKVLLDIL
uniref:Transcription factor MYB124-like isoform X2 n=1 Tax=Cymbidium sinense TaxID=112615 RepID=A0A455LAB6_9ASPA|nr:transcription factor MYB124-like isoform X2 [Cymbidium sinense]